MVDDTAVLRHWLQQPRQSQLPNGVAVEAHDDQHPTPFQTRLAQIAAGRNIEFVA